MSGCWVWGRTQAAVIAKRDFLRSDENILELDTGDSCTIL